MNTRQDTNEIGKTRITTKYSYPRISSTKAKPKSTASPISAAALPGSQIAATPPATLTLKTYNPGAGICLKYRTDKAAEVGRLIAGLGKLASGAAVTEVGATAAAGGVGTADVEMIDPPKPASVVGGKALNTANAGNGGPGSGGSGTGAIKSKRKGVKGKR